METESFLIPKNGGQKTPQKFPEFPGDLNRLIDAALAEIDQARESWNGWRGSLSEEQRDRLKATEAEVDAAARAIYDRQARERQGQRSDIQENLPECSGQARDAAGKAVGVSGERRRLERALSEYKAAVLNEIV